ncbi:response regulator transcription factor [Marinicella meishanensis]|uniref:response regulator transcription factor n=1 Tax=Marinicella meishanensis TaxID=2873263 RepID=UPI001CBFB8B3|nr:response regulator transcription factor [Marinicella sp. NBU2979]
MSDAPKLLIVEDDERLAQLIQSYFERAGFHTKVVSQGAAAIESCHRQPPDLVLLDLMLPDMDGIAVLRQIRQQYPGKVLMMTASGSDIDQVMGFETGADDYVNKPVEPRVLLARVNSLLKRRAIDKQRDQDELVFGSMSINNLTKSVTLNQEIIKLTTHEFDLLHLLAKNAGSVLTRDDIYHHLRGLDYDGSDRAVDIKISRLRKKLGDDATEPQRIKTIWGKGYLFVPSAWSV